VKVYFGSSPRTKEKYPESIRSIFEKIKKMGYVHTSDWVYKISPEEFYALSDKEMEKHHKEMMASIKRADICVFEVSVHSLSVGYLVNFSLETGKTVVVVSKNNSSLFLFKNINSDRLITVTYSDSNLDEKIGEALESASKGVDVRFNFFVSSKILAYLDWIAKTKRVPRSVFLRNLIEREMKKDKGFRE